MADKLMEQQSSPFTSLVSRWQNQEPHLEQSLNTNEEQNRELKELNEKVVGFYERLKKETEEKHPKKVVTDNGDGTYSYFYLRGMSSFDDPSIWIRQTSEYKEVLEDLDPCIIKEVDIDFLSKNPNKRKIVKIYDVDTARLSGATSLTYHNFREDIVFPDSVGPESEVSVSRIKNVVSPLIESFDNPRVKIMG